MERGENCARRGNYRRDMEARGAEGAGRIRTCPQQIADAALGFANIFLVFKDDIQGATNGGSLEFFDAESNRRPCSVQGFGDAGRFFSVEFAQSANKSRHLSAESLIKVRHFQSDNTCFLFGPGKVDVEMQAASLERFG